MKIVLSWWKNKIIHYKKKTNKQTKKNCLILVKNA